MTDAPKLEEHICALVRDYRDRPIGPDRYASISGKRSRLAQPSSTLRSAIS